MTPATRDRLAACLAHQDAALLLLHHAHATGDPDYGAAVMASLDRLQALSTAVRALLLTPPAAASHGSGTS